MVKPFRILDGPGEGGVVSDAEVSAALGRPAPAPAPAATTATAARLCQVCRQPLPKRFQKAHPGRCHLLWRRHVQQQRRARKRS